MRRTTWVVMLAVLMLAGFGCAERAPMESDRTGFAPGAIVADGPGAALVAPTIAPLRVGVDITANGWPCQVYVPVQFNGSGTQWGGMMFDVEFDGDLFEGGWECRPGFIVDKGAWVDSIGAQLNANWIQGRLARVVIQWGPGNRTIPDGAHLCTIVVQKELDEPDPWDTEAVVSNLSTFDFPVTGGADSIIWRDPGPGGAGL